MSVEVNWLAVLLATVSAMVVGFIWYHKKVFGTMWMNMAGLTDAEMKKNMAAPMVTALVGSLLTAFLLAHMAFIAHTFYGGSFFADAVTTAFWLWLGISATSLAIHYSFEQKPAKYIALAIGNRFVTIMVMGAIIGALHP